MYRSYRQTKRSLSPSEVAGASKQNKKCNSNTIVLQPKECSDSISNCFDSQYFPQIREIYQDAFSCSITARPKAFVSSLKRKHRDIFQTLAIQHENEEEKETTVAKFGARHHNKLNLMAMFVQVHSNEISFRVEANLKPQQINIEIDEDKMMSEFYEAVKAFIQGRKGVEYAEIFNLVNINKDPLWQYIDGNYVGQRKIFMPKNNITVKQWINTAMIKLQSDYGCLNGVDVQSCGGLHVYYEVDDATRGVAWELTEFALSRQSWGTPQEIKVSDEIYYIMLEY